MEKIKVGVVEDEVIIANNIINSLSQLGYGTIGPALSYSQAIELFEQTKPDIVLLDIILAGRKDGIDLAWKIKEDFKIPFIFLTSHADKSTVERAKQVDPPAYLVKPFNKEELYCAIEIALFNYSKNKRINDLPADHNSEDSNFIMKDSLFVKHKGKFQKVPYSEILFLKNDNIYIEITTVKNTFLVRSNMNEYLQKFPSNFIRVHRSYAINSDYLESISNDEITIGEHNIPLSRNYKEELLAKINIG